MSLWWSADPFSNDAPSKERMARTSLVAQGFKLHTPIAKGMMGSIPGRGTKIPYALQQYKKKKKKNDILMEYVWGNCIVNAFHVFNFTSTHSAPKHKTKQKTPHREKEPLTTLGNSTCPPVGGADM